MIALIFMQSPDGRGPIKRLREAIKMTSSPERKICINEMTRRLCANFFSTGDRCNTATFTHTTVMRVCSKPNETNHSMARLDSMVRIELSVKCASQVFKMYRCSNRLAHPNDEKAIEKK